MTPHELAFRAAAMAAIAKHALAQKDHYREKLSAVMANGDRFVPADPAHPAATLGRVNKTEPDHRARVADRDALIAWLTPLYPGHLVTEEVIPPERLSRAVAVLRQHAPELVVTTTRIASWAETEILNLTIKAREPCGPGGETGVPGVECIQPSEGTVTVTPKQDALEIITAMVREGRLDIRTGEILAIEEKRGED